jgi:hypothetical protein
VSILQRWNLWRTRRLLRSNWRRGLSVRPQSDFVSRSGIERYGMSQEDQLRNALIIEEFRRQWDVPA